MLADLLGDAAYEHHVRCAGRPPTSRVFELETHGEPGHVTCKHGSCGSPAPATCEPIGLGGSGVRAASSSTASAAAQRRPLVGPSGSGAPECTTPAPLTALADTAAAQRRPLVGPSGSGAPEYKEPPLWRAQKADLQHMMTVRGLLWQDLTVPQMRETLRQADPKFLPRHPRDGPGVSRLRKQQLVSLAIERGIDATGTAEQLRLRLQGWTPTELSGTSGSRIPSSPMPSAPPAAIRETPSTSPPAEPPTEPMTVHRTAEGRRLCMECGRGMLLDEDEETGDFLWMCKFARCSGPTIPYNDEDADWVELEVQEVQDETIA